jgi:serine/threonine protein kinase
MLDKNPETRISMRDIMDHPWLKKYRERKMNQELGIENSDDESADEEFSTRK